MAGFEAMVERWRDRVNTFAYYTLGSREDAEDVTQDVMLRLWQHWPRLDQDDSAGWIIRVTRNACLDRSRRRRTRRGATAALTRVDQPGVGPTAMPNPDSALEDRELQSRVQEALGTIAEPFRTILILRDIEDTPCAEIAEALGLTPNAVRVYSHRGRRMLRAKLQEDSIA